MVQRVWPLPREELHDVDMAEASPPKRSAPGEDTEKENGKGRENEERGKVEKKENGRVVATGGVRRMFRSRRRAQILSPARQEDGEGGEDEGCSSDSDGGEDGMSRGRGGSLARTTSNHYTLNMSATPASPSDTPYVLLG